MVTLILNNKNSKINFEKVEINIRNFYLKKLHVIN